MILIVVTTVVYYDYYMQKGKTGNITSFNRNYVLKKINIISVIDDIKASFIVIKGKLYISYIKEDIPNP